MHEVIVWAPYVVILVAICTWAAIGIIRERKKKAQELPPGRWVIRDPMGPPVYVPTAELKVPPEPPVEEVTRKQLVDRVDEAMALGKAQMALGKAQMAEDSKNAEVQRQISLGIDALLAEQRQFRKSFDSWMKAMFGDGTRGYTEMTDEEAVLREDAAALVQRYGLNYEDAMARAKAASVYKTQGGMGGRA